MQRIRDMNLQTTVPVRGQLSVGQAVLILVINLILPGIGTAILACFAHERNYMNAMNAAALHILKQADTDV